MLNERDGNGDHDTANIVVYLNADGKPTATSTIQAEPTQGSQEISERDKGDDGPDSEDRIAIGVTYSPYNKDHSCKSEGQVAQDLANLDFKVVRLYGTDCSQVANVLKAMGRKTLVFAGIFDIEDVESEVSSLVTQVSGDWKRITAVSIGNELVNSGGASVDKVVAAVGKARTALKAHGYTGAVVTVDTMMAMQSHPQLCLASDFCAINCHAFFDGHVQPAEAGKFVADWAAKISEAAGGKRVVVTESGWPSRGTPNKAAVPGVTQQQEAIRSLKASFSKDLILYTLYNDLWKQDRPDTFGAEKWWGLQGSSK